MRIYKSRVNLGMCVLIFTYNYGIVVLPQHTVTVVAVKRIKHKLFQRQIITGICFAAFDVECHDPETIFFQSEGETPVLFLKSREK